MHAERSKCGVTYNFEVTQPIVASIPHGGLGDSFVKTELIEW